MEQHASIGVTSSCHKVEQDIRAADLLSACVMVSIPCPELAKSSGAVLQQIAKRRAALASAHLEAGQGFWLAKQRWLWRRGRLSREQFLMLQLAGLEMDIDPPMQWKRLAHETAHYLNGSQIDPDQASHVSLCMAEAWDIMIHLHTGCTVACDLMPSPCGHF